MSRLKRIKVCTIVCTWYYVSYNKEPLGILRISWLFLSWAGVWPSGNLVTRWTMQYYQCVSRKTDLTPCSGVQENRKWYSSSTFRALQILRKWSSWSVSVNLPTSISTLQWQNATGEFGKETSLHSRQISQHNGVRTVSVLELSIATEFWFCWDFFPPIISWDYM